MLRIGRGIKYSFGFQHLFQTHFALVQPAEFVDLVLIFSPDFELILCHSRLIFFRELSRVNTKEFIR